MNLLDIFVVAIVFVGSYKNCFKFRNAVRNVQLLCYIKLRPVGIVSYMSILLLKVLFFIILMA
jgi:hypothetical protein